MTAQATSGPLSGYRVIELTGIGPGPYCGQLLSDLGAEVICLDRPGADLELNERRGKKSVGVNLQADGAAEIVLRLVETADALIEGFRPGVAERLGVGPDECHARNKKLVYGRMTGWGQEGPWSSVAGHDINYIAVTGALHAMGEAGETAITAAQSCRRLWRRFAVPRHGGACGVVAGGENRRGRCGRRIHCRWRGFHDRYCELP